jgi:hypothetical protein
MRQFADVDDDEDVVDEDVEDESLEESIIELSYYTRSSHPNADPSIDGSI